MSATPLNQSDSRKISPYSHNTGSIVTRIHIKSPYIDNGIINSRLLDETISTLDCSNILPNTSSCAILGLRPSYYAGVSQHNFHRALFSLTEPSDQVWYSSVTRQFDQNKQKSSLYVSSIASILSTTPDYALDILYYHVLMIAQAQRTTDSTYIILDIDPYISSFKRDTDICCDNTILSSPLDSGNPMLSSQMLEHELVLQHTSQSPYTLDTILELCKLYRDLFYMVEIGMSCNDIMMSIMCISPQSQNNDKYNDIVLDHTKSDIYRPIRIGYASYILPSIFFHEPCLSDDLELSGNAIDFTLSRLICHMSLMYGHLPTFTSLHLNILCQFLPSFIEQYHSLHISSSIFPQQHSIRDEPMSNPPSHNLHAQNSSNILLDTKHITIDPFLNYIIQSDILYKYTDQHGINDLSRPNIADCHNYGLFISWDANINDIHQFIHFLGDKYVDINHVYTTDPRITLSTSPNPIDHQISQCNNQYITNSFRHGCFGGTFDHIHAGHHSLLIALGMVSRSSALLGITHPHLLSHKSHAHCMEDWPQRVFNVISFLILLKGGCKGSSLRHIASTRSSITPIVIAPFQALIGSSHFPFGISIDPLVDMFSISTKDPRIECLIVSDEVQSGARMVNTLRKQYGYNDANIISVPLVFPLVPLSSTDMKISSTMVRSIIDIISTLLQSSL